MLLYPLDIEAQSGVQHWNTDNGLSNNWVSDILQDQDGYIWIATQYGLNKFDGYSFSNLKYEPNNKNSLNANWVKKMCQDESGNIWLATYFGGISKLDSKSGKIQRLNFKNLGPVYDLYCDKYQNLWIGSANGLYLKKSESTSFNKVIDIRVETIAPGKDGNLFCYSLGKVFLFEPAKQSIDTIWNDNDLPIKQIAAEGDNGLWAINDQQLLRIEYKNENWTSTSLLEKSAINFNAFYQPLLQIDAQRNLWIGAQNGIIKFNPSTRDKEFIELSELYPKGENPGQVLSLSYDKHGNQWIGTTEGLLLHAKYAKRFEIDRKYNAIQSIKNVREILQIDDKFWLANTEGLYLFDTDGLERKFSINSATTLFPINQNELLVGGRIIQKIKLDDLSIESIPALKNYLGVWSIEKDRAGIFWISSISGLFRYDASNDIVDHYIPENVPSLKSKINQGLYLDSKGHLWASSLKSGVYFLKNPHLLRKGETPSFKHIPHIEGDEKSLTSPIVTVIEEDRDGFIWVGTDGGLNRINPKNFQVRQFLNKDGLLDEKIMSLVLDDQGFLWGTSAGHGIFRLDTKTNHFSFFDKKDGLVNNNFLLSSVFKNQEGHLFFGSNDITQIIDPSKINSFSKPNTSFFFTDIHLADEEQTTILIDSTNRIELDYLQDVFTVHFTTLNYFQASETEYLYRIKGVQNDWQTNKKSRSIAFNGLEAGNYTLEVKAVNPDLYFTNDIITLKIKVTPPWWKSAWAYFFYILLALSIFYFVYQARLKVRMKNFEADRVKELDNLKTRFYINITHELRTPLSVIIGEAQRLQSSIKNEIKNKGTIIYRNGQQLLDLINQILDLSKLESGKLPIKLQHSDILPLLSYLLGAFQSLADKKDIRLHFLSSLPDLHMDFDAEKVKRIISNLLSNALKYTNEGGDIYLQVKRENHLAIISVKDTGTGIKKEDLSLIFDRYYQSSDNQGGTGIGLSLTRELVHLLGGTINVESKLNKGANFIIKLPIEHKETTPIIPYEKPLENGLILKESIKKEIKESYWQEGEKPLMQIVEDHDDVRNFLISVMKEEYRILESEDGTKAYEKALEHIPDLIISDVMMPGIDGFELCRKLKQHELTNHIPIILLTAKADLPSRIEGLEQGADAYLQKPFESDELRVRVKKLLELRLKLQDRYLNSVAAHNEEKIQDEFLLKANTIIIENMSNTTFGIPELCRQLGISRAHLHRKLKALTGQSTSIFIRTIRLQKAQELLKKGAMNVSEVAYEVGFSDPSYFSRLYSDYFGSPPSETSK